MKVLYRISIILNVCSICYLLIWGSDVFTKKMLHVNEIDEKAQMEPIREVVQKEETLSCDTEYFVSKYDVTTGEESYEQEKIPNAYIGKTRKQILKLLEDYNKTPSLEDREHGFLSAELSSFSRKRLSILKTYETSCYYGCVVVEDGYLSVYDENRENVYLYTDILFEQLPEDMKEQVLDGKYFKTEDELYNFLESYSS